MMVYVRCMFYSPFPQCGFYSRFQPFSPSLALKVNALASKIRPWPWPWPRGSGLGLGLGLEGPGLGLGLGLKILALTTSLQMVDLRGLSSDELVFGVRSIEVMSLAIVGAKWST